MFLTVSILVNPICIVIRTGCEMSFEAIPILDLSLSRQPETKPAFLESLRNALLEVGFLYISNTGISDDLTKDVIQQGKAFFDLPEDKKLEIQMNKCPSFLGMPSREDLAVHRLTWDRLQCVG